MTTDRPVRVAIVGLGFGAEFIPIYQRHPDAEMYAICRRNRAELDACGDRFVRPALVRRRALATVPPSSRLTTLTEPPMSGTCTGCAPRTSASRRAACRAARTPDR